MKKTILVLMGVALIATTALIYSCSKEENANNEEQNTIRKKGVEKLEITDSDIFFAENKDGEIGYGFDLDELSKQLFDKTSSCVVEELEVLDSIQPKETGWVEAHLVVYNTKEDIPESYWFPIKKIDNKYYYNIKGTNGNGNSEKPAVKCIPKDKCQKGCLRRFDKNGRFLGCLCQGNSGYCKEGEYTTDKIAIIGMILITIVGSIHFHFNI